MQLGADMEMCLRLIYFSSFFMMGQYESKISAWLFNKSSDLNSAMVNIVMFQLMFNFFNNDKFLIKA